MVEDITFKKFWACDDCGAILNAYEWMQRYIASYPSVKGEYGRTLAYYACPKCLKKVELRSVE